MARARSFRPGIIDYDGRMSAEYQAGRALSSDAANTWREVVAPFVRSTARRLPERLDGVPYGLPERLDGVPYGLPERLDGVPCRPRIVDVGAGTGRFATLFAESFDAEVLAIEPSRGMLAIAATGSMPANLTYLAGAAESIPLHAESCDLAWLSHVWHHVKDHRACTRELRRIVCRAGHVLVRGTFGDVLDGFPTLFEFWPATRDICEQLPTIDQTVAAFAANGFELREHRRVSQVTAASLGEFAARTKRRADSALALIPDAEFRQGQGAIEQAAAHAATPDPVVEVIELLVFE